MFNVNIDLVVCHPPFLLGYKKRFSTPFRLTNFFSLFNKLKSETTPLYHLFNSAREV